MKILELQVDSSGFPTPRRADELQALASMVETRPVEALAALLDLADAALSERDYPAGVMSLLLGAKAAYHCQRLELGRAAAVRAVECARQTGDLVGEAHAYRLLALVAFDQGRSKDGHDHLLDAIAAFEDAGAGAEVPLLMRWYGEHLAVLGAHAEAKHALETAAGRFRSLGDVAAAEGCERDIATL